MRIGLALLLCGLGVVSIALAHAEVPVIEAAGSNTEVGIEQRVDRLEKMVGTQNVDLLHQITQLQQQVSQLQGQLEQAQHQLETLKSATGVASTTGATVVGASSESVADTEADPQIKQSYVNAFKLVQEKHYTPAVEALQQFLKDYPKSSYALNAHYWLGEIYLVQGKADLAIAEFKTITTMYASSTRASDALLKLGFVYYDQSQWTLARAQLMAVTQRYPNTTNAEAAATRLKQMQDQGV